MMSKKLFAHLCQYIQEFRDQGFTIYYQQVQPSSLVIKERFHYLILFLNTIVFQIKVINPFSKILYV